MSDNFNALKEAFKRDSMRLEEAVLILCGHPPGPWLWFDNSVRERLKDPVAFKLFYRALCALRGGKFKGVLEGMNWYVQLFDLGRWALNNKIPFDESIHDFAQSYLEKNDTLKKRGRPKSCGSIVLEITSEFQKKGIRKIATSDLECINSDLIAAYMSQGKGRPERRRKTLIDSVNELLI